LSQKATRRLGLLTAGGLSIACGLALAWGAVDPMVVRAVPTGGLVLIVAMVALPVLLMATAGAAKLTGAGTTTETEPSHDAVRPAGSAGVGGVVRHESHGGDRHERPHAPRTHRSRSAHRAIESGDGVAEV
jgi:hypothetical protein